MFEKFLKTYKPWIILISIFIICYLFPGIAYVLVGFIVAALAIIGLMTIISVDYVKKMINKTIRNIMGY